jgi:hypothetical protein
LYAGGNDQPVIQSLVVAFPMLSLAEDGEARVRQDRGLSWLALFCFLVFDDTVVSRIERHSHPQQWLRWEGGL